MVTAARDAARYAAGDADPATAAVNRLKVSTPGLGLKAPSVRTLARIETDPTLGEQVLHLHVAVPYTPAIGLLPTPTELVADVDMLLETT